MSAIEKLEPLLEVGSLSPDEDDNLIGPEIPQEFKEFSKMEFIDLNQTKSPKIACVMMVKNEKKRISVTLDSVVNSVCAYIIFDTGSEDDTKEIIIEHCKKHQKNLYMIVGNFVNFSVSRNCLLDYADKIPVDFLLLMDTNDELKGGEQLVKFAKEEINTERTAYLTCQQWWSNRYDYYWNVRFIKPRRNWRFICVVHEVLDHPKEGCPTYRVDANVILYQDRTLDDDKTGKRFSKDKAFLRREYLKNPRDARTVFYLAQTYSCLCDYQNSYRFYKERYDIHAGFWEERFQAALRAGDMCQKLNLDWKEAHDWFLKAYIICDRAEPLIYIAEHYNQEKNWSLAHLYAKRACDLEFPHQCTLFIDKRCYDYERFHKLGIVSFYYGKYEDGKWACEKALEHSPNSEIDRNNLKFYKERDSKTETTLTKNEYFRLRQEKIKNENPTLRPKQITNKIKLEWKMKNLKL